MAALYSYRTHNSTQNRRTVRNSLEAAPEDHVGNSLEAAPEDHVGNSLEAAPEDHVGKERRAARVEV